MRGSPERAWWLLVALGVAAGQAHAVSVSDLRNATAGANERSLQRVRSTAESVFQALRADEARRIDLRTLVSEEERDAAAAGLVKLTDEPMDWNRRLRLAEDLAALGHPAATARLIEWATQKEDVRLAWVAMRGLGELPSPETERTLATLSTSHWFGPVREQAQRSRGKLRRAMGLPEVGDSGYGKFVPTHVTHLGIGCERVRPVGREDALRMQVDGEPSPVVFIVSPELRLVGTDIGEFGGDVHAVTREGEATLVLDGNTHHIGRLGDHVVAVTGLAHLSGNEGMVYRLAADAAGRWRASPWRALPGAPRSVEVSADDVLRVDTYQGGRVAISADGTMRQERCDHAAAFD